MLALHYLKMLKQMFLTFWLAAISNSGSFDAIVVLSVNEFQTPFLKKWLEVKDMSFEGSCWEKSWRSLIFVRLCFEDMRLKGLEKESEIEGFIGNCGIGFWFEVLKLRHRILVWRCGFWCVNGVYGCSVCC